MVNAARAPRRRAARKQGFSVVSVPFSRLSSTRLRSRRKPQSSVGEAASALRGPTKQTSGRLPIIEAMQKNFGGGDLGQTLRTLATGYFAWTLIRHSSRSQTSPTRRIPKPEEQSTARKLIQPFCLLLTILLHQSHLYPMGRARNGVNSTVVDFALSTFAARDSTNLNTLAKWQTRRVLSTH